MEKIELLESRRKQAAAQNKSALGFASSILDEASFVETDSFYFAGNDLVDNGTVFGEGVVCGSGTVGGIPVCLFVQNFDVLKGGLSKGQADKIVKCMQNAESAGLPLVSVLHTAGARLGEGIRALDGYAKVLKEFSSLKGQIPLITVVKGEVYGTMSAFSALSDFTFVMKDGQLASGAPAVITANSGKDKSLDFFSAKSLASRGIAARVCKDNSALKSDLAALLDLLAGGQPELEETEANVSASALNKAYSALAIIDKVLDKGTFFELWAESGKELRAGFARIGGCSVGVVICSDEPAVITSAACRKYTRLLTYLSNNDIPLLNFVNAKGFAQSLEEEDGILSGEAFVFDRTADSDNLKIAVVCGLAAGSAYSAFVSKEIGVDRSFAWATASISPLPGAQGAEIVYADEIKAAKDHEKAREQAAKKYAELEGDVFSAVSSGSVDEIIEPAFTRQYILSVLVGQYE